MFYSRTVAQLPAGWIGKDSITLIAPDGGANVIASTEPVDLEIDATRYAEIQGEILSTEFPGYHEIEFSAIELTGGVPAYIRRFSWTPPDGERVNQIQLYGLVGPGRALTATATVTAIRLSEYEAILTKILSSLSFNRE